MEIDNSKVEALSTIVVMRRLNKFILWLHCIVIITPIATCLIYHWGSVCSDGK